MPSHWFLHACTSPLSALLLRRSLSVVWGLLLLLLQQHRAWGSTRRTPGRNHSLDQFPRPPIWGIFNLCSWINTEGGRGCPWCHQPSPGRRDAGHSQCTDLGFSSLFSSPKAPQNSPHGPILTTAIILGGTKEKTPKGEQARRASPVQSDGTQPSPPAAKGNWSHRGYCFGVWAQKSSSGN